MHRFHKNGMVAAVALLISGTAANAADTDIEALQRQIDAQSQQLQAQFQQINALSQQLNALKAQPAAPTAAASAAISGVGSFPGSFIIPGTNTSIKVGGFADLSVTYDANTNVGAPGGLTLNGFQPKSITPNSITSLGNSNISLPGTPAAKEVGRFQASPRWSRVSLETRTPSEYGEIKFYVESDFNGDGLDASKNLTNSVAPRLRQAYGAIGNLLLGQATMLAYDAATYPESIDYNPVLGFEAGNRMPVVQYRWDIDAAQKNQAYAGLELPYNDYLGRDNSNFQSGAVDSQPTDNVTHVPDFAAKIARNGSWGRIFAAGTVRNIEVDTFGVPKVYGTNASQVAHDSVIGGGFTAGGKLRTTLGDPRNAIVFRIDGGQGAGRLLQGGAPSAVVDNHGHLQLQQQGGFGVSYQHWFNDTWKANANYSLSHVWNKTAYQSTQGLWKQSQEAELNLFWMPTRYAQIGVAYMWIAEDAVQGYCLSTACGGTTVAGATRTWSGSSAYDNRFVFRSRIGF